MFHSDGDMNRFYDELADAGFTGVHVAVGDSIASIQSAFRAARLNRLVPVGGVTPAMLEGEPQVDRVLDLMFAGDCLISDDGGITSAAQVAQVGRLYLQVCETHPSAYSIRALEG